MRESSDTLWYTYKYIVKHEISFIAEFIVFIYLANKNKSKNIYKFLPVHIYTHTQFEEIYITKTLYFFGTKLLCLLFPFPFSIYFS